MLLPHTPMAMLPQPMATTMVTYQPTTVFTSVMLRLNQRLMLRLSLTTMVVCMVTLDMALAPMDTPPMLLLPHTPMAMLPQPTMATMPTMAFTSVMLKLSQSLMPTIMVVFMDMVLDLMDMVHMALLVHMLMDHMLIQPTADTTIKSDVEDLPRMLRLSNAIHSSIHHYFLMS